jgi:lipopolysaccharide transport system ATP-binding protein
MQDISIRLQGVGKTYRIYSHPSDRLKQSLARGRKHYFAEHTALLPLTLDIPRGQTVGVVGVNGSGKSTLLQLITRTLTPSCGEIEVRGRVSALLELGAGFNPEFTGDENIFLNASIMGLSRAEVTARYDEIVAFSGLQPHLLKQPVKTYSSGMYVRLAFAVAIAVEPDILIVDEALAVGDEGFQRKCFARIRALQERGATILFVSHSARAVVDLCDHALLLDGGELLMQGTPAAVVAQYHKMLFAREEDRPAIRASILAKAQDISTQLSSAPLIMPPPESRTEYVSDGGRIEAVRLTDISGNETILLTQGEYYRLDYRVLCDRAMASLKCSMMLKTMTGIELAGMLSNGGEASLNAVEAGQTLDVSFCFRCTLIKGDYFLNVGVVEEQLGTHRFVHRIVDALHLKVQENDANPNSQPRGFVDLGIECNIIAV